MRMRGKLRIHTSKLGRAGLVGATVHCSWFIKLHKGSLVSATSRSLLKLDQAHIAVGGREHISLMSVKL